MSIPEQHVTAQGADAQRTTAPLIRAAIWVAIGALIAAAVVCVVWVFVGSDDGIIGKAFLTILLLVAFSGAGILDAHLAPNRPSWFALSSMIGWVALLLIGAVMIWMPERYTYAGFTRFVQFLVIALIVQLVLLHLRLFVRASARYVTTFTQVVSIVTIVLVVALAVLLIVPLVLQEWVDFADLYWRFVVATAILAAVGTMLVPLVNVLFAPKRPSSRGYAAGPQPQQSPYAALPAGPSPAQTPPPWPTFVDGATPLPYLPDGSPDWNAYYTGYPSPGAQMFVMPAESAPSQPGPSQAGPTEPGPAESAHAPSGPPTAPEPSGYEGYPPPPPVPPRP